MIFFSSSVLGHALELTQRRIQLPGQTIPTGEAARNPMDFITTCKQTMTLILPRENKKKDTLNEVTKHIRNEVDPHSEKVVPLLQTSSQHSQQAEDFHRLCAIFMDDDVFLEKNLKGNFTLKPIKSVDSSADV